jgi:DNA repair exonuclease SbcCD ATPase subunit
MNAFQPLALMFFLCISLTPIAQTAGSGTLSRIESLAQKELANSEKVGELNRKHMDTYVLEDLKLQRLESELREAEKKQLKVEMSVEDELEAKLDEIENGQSWINRRESAERGYKEYNPGRCNAGGPPPICVADHWYRVSYDEAMREYNALVERELDKIRDKKTRADIALKEKREELQEFQFGENEFAKKRDDINDEMNEILAENSDLRSEIEALSKVYVEKVKSEAETKQNSDLKPWLNTIAQKHHAELKIGILQAEIEELNDDEEEAIIQLENDLRQENDLEIQEREQTIFIIKSELQAFLKSSDDELDSDKKKLSSKKSQLYETEKELEKKDQLPPEEVQRLEVLVMKLEPEIELLEAKIESLERNQKVEKTRMESEVKLLEDEIWDLKINLPSLILEEVNDLREAYAAKREILNDAISGRQLKLESIEQALRNHESSFRAKVSDYENILEPERRRLLDACSASGCSCWGAGIVGDVWSIANSLISCAFQLENDSMYYTGCEKASETYRSDYNRMINGISDREIGVLKRQNSEYQFESLLKKFN